jgi:hypothetical protein
VWTPAGGSGRGWAGSAPHGRTVIVHGEESAFSRVSLWRTSLLEALGVGGSPGQSAAAVVAGASVTDAAAGAAEAEAGRSRFSAAQQQTAAAQERSLPCTAGFLPPGEAGPADLASSTGEGRDAHEARRFDQEFLAAEARAEAAGATAVPSDEPQDGGNPQSGTEQV